MPRTQQAAPHLTGSWPHAPLEDWAQTRATLHMWTEIVGKIRLALAPMVNHWWQVPLYVSTRGLTTSAIPYAGRTFEMEFDFCDHHLHVRSSDGRERLVVLEPKSVAAFYHEVLAVLDELGIEVSFWPTRSRSNPPSRFPRTSSTPRTSRSTSTASGCSSPRCSGC